MKDILFKKHYDQIFEIDMGADTAKDNKRFDTAVACANTTKEIAKGFAEWIGGKYFWFYSTRDEAFYWRENEDEKLTTEQLLEKYLLTLNQ